MCVQDSRDIDMERLARKFEPVDFGVPQHQILEIAVRPSALMDTVNTQPSVCVCVCVCVCPQPLEPGVLRSQIVSALTSNLGIRISDYTFNLADDTHALVS